MCKLHHFISCQNSLTFTDILHRMSYEEPFVLRVLQIFELQKRLSGPVLCLHSWFDRHSKLKMHKNVILGLSPLLSPTTCCFSIFSHCCQLHHHPYSVSNPQSGGYPLFPSISISSSPMLVGSKDLWAFPTNKIPSPLQLAFKGPSYLPPIPRLSYAL